MRGDSKNFFLNILNSFKNSVPGRTWFKLFRKRHPCLTLRVAQNFPKNRAESLSKSILDDFFKMVAEKYDELDMYQKPTHIFNVDESGFSGDQGKQMIICAKGSKNPCLVSASAAKVHYTVNFCCNAAGQFLPPFIVYKAKGRLHEEWCTNGPDDARYTVSKSGWMETDQFLQWFEDIFIGHTSHLIGPKILFLDGHSSHVSIELIDLAKKNNVELLCLPSHTTHVLQPLDVGVFSVVKAVWKKNLREFYLSSGSENITKNNFPSLLANLYQEAFKPPHAVGGFYKCGLFPLDQSKLAAELVEITRPFQGDLSTEDTVIVAHTPVISSISITNTRSASATIPVSLPISVPLPIPATQDPPTSDQDCLLSPIEKASKDLNFSILKHLSFNLSNKKKNTRGGIKMSGKSMTGNVIS